MYQNGFRFIFRNRKENYCAQISMTIITILSLRPQIHTNMTKTLLVTCQKYAESYLTNHRNLTCYLLHIKEKKIVSAQTATNGGFFYAKILANTRLESPSWQRVTVKTVMTNEVFKSRWKQVNIIKDKGENIN